MGTARLLTLQLLLLLGAWRARGGAARCRVTLVLSPHKATGAVCGNADASHDGELAALRMRVGRQEELLRALQRRAAEGGALAGEVRALREQSHGLNARLGQLRAQLQPEAEPDPGAEPAAALSLLAQRALHAETEARRTAELLQQLDAQLREHAQLVSQHSGLLGRLQRACADPDRGQQQVLPLPLVPLVPLNLVGSAGNTSRRLDGTPENRRDQNLRQQELLSPPPPTGHLAVSTRPVGPWRDCAEAHGAGHRQSGVYELRLGRRLVSVWCEQQREGGGWTVIQRRQDGSVNFFTNWQHYKAGFGRPDGEYWLGLEPVHQVTSRGDHELLVLLEDWGGRGARAHYDSFSLEPESDHYRLRLGQYHGDAGDSLSWHNDKPFSTVDRDRDSYSGNCALYHRGGWWYHACAHSNLNGVWYHGGHYRSRYQDGVYWAEFRGGAYSLKKAVMLTRLVRL